MNYRDEAPEVVRGFLTYHETVKGHSRKTVDEYYLDIRMFLRFMKLTRGIVSQDTDFDTIPINDIDISFIKTITLSDIYDYLNFLSRDRIINHNSTNPEYGIGASARARKVATLKSFFKYLTIKANLLEINPVKDLDSPKIKKSLPRYLTLDESEELLSSVDGKHKERDYCILTLFLNCGMRISELVGLNLSDVHSDSLRILGKGNKERIVYLNQACADAINAYLPVRGIAAGLDSRALFLSSQHKRISKSTVHALVKKHLEAAGLDATKYSSHKLRHTAATLMLQNGVDVRTLQELLGHEHLNTTEIYTHIDNSNLRSAAAANPLAGFSAEKNKKTK